MRSWGRQGGQGNQRQEGSYPDQERAMPVTERLIRGRFKRRYELVDWT